MLFRSYSIYFSHADRTQCCSRACSFNLRSKTSFGSENPNWRGGNSRLPYTFDFKRISRSVIERFGFKCMNPDCRGKDCRLTTHHINYDTRDNSARNLISLCSSCNSRANFDRDRWRRIYSEIIDGLSAASGCSRNSEREE